MEISIKKNGEKKTKIKYKSIFIVKNFSYIKL